MTDILLYLGHTEVTTESLESLNPVGSNEVLTMDKKLDKVVQHVHLTSPPNLSGQ